MNVYIDIETLPDMTLGELDRITKEVSDNFKAPSSLTKTQAVKDLGLGAKDAKYIAAADITKQWEQRFSKEKAPGVAKEQWRKGSLSPDKGGQILSIGFAVEDGPVKVCYGGEFDSGLLGEFASLLHNQLNGRAPYFIGHNVPFDLEFIWKRAVINNIKLPFSVKPHGRHGKDFYDTMQAWAGFKGRISQDRLAKLLGLEEKPNDINGSNVLDHYLNGDHQRIQEYNIYDVETVIDIYNRLTKTFC